MSGGGIVRVVACVAAVEGVTSRGGGGEDDDGSDGDDSGSVGTEYWEPCEWLRTCGGSSVGMGGGIVATVWPDDFDILDEMESRE